ncbi:hypothetical protein JT359_19930 [Candidatus Poribacteria bacterium]|nr:hypothetical protein [Candidatus Poribacteria bacterium]
MKMSQRFFLLGSSLFTFFCFCLPWIDGESGFEHIDDDGPYTLIVVLISIGCILLWKSKIPIVCSSLIGIILLMILLNNNLYYTEYGLTLTIMSFFLTIAGARFFPKEN